MNIMPKVEAKDDKSWLVQLPMLLIKQGASDFKTKTLTINLMIRNIANANKECHLQVVDLSFAPEAKAPLIGFFRKFSFDYKPKLNNTPPWPSDLAKPGVSDQVVITAANLFFLKKEPDLAKSLKKSFIILQQGIIDGSYSWRLDNSIVYMLIQRSKDETYTLSIKNYINKKQ